MADLIISVVLVVLVGAAVLYIRKEKKKGTRCIGCPAAGTCAHSAGKSGCGCHTE